MEWGAAWEIQHPHSKEEIEAKSSLTFPNQVLEPRLLAKPTSLRACLYTFEQRLYLLLKEVSLPTSKIHFGSIV